MTMTKEYHLQVPIKVNSEARNTLTIRRPRAIDFEALDEVEGTNRRQLALIANCAGISPTEAGELDGYDFHQLAEIVNDFFLKAPKAPDVKNQTQRS
jgi:hypothetical protein